MEMSVSFLRHILLKKQKPTFTTSNISSELNHSVENISAHARCPRMTVTPITQHERIAISNIMASFGEVRKLYIFRIIITINYTSTLLMHKRESLTVRGGKRRIFEHRQFLRITVCTAEIGNRRNRLRQRPCHNINRASPVHTGKGTL